MIYILPFYAIMVPYFFLVFCMLIAHIVDHKVCKIYLVSLTNKENNTFETTPFVKLIINKYTHTTHDLNNPPEISVSIF